MDQMYKQKPLRVQQKTQNEQTDKQQIPADSRVKDTISANSSCADVSSNEIDSIAAIATNTTTTSTAKAKKFARAIPGRGQYSEAARQKRLDFIRKQTNRPLPGIGITQYKAESLSNNIEALIGSVEVPLGLAGPLKFTGEKASGTYYAPLATSEGALIASVTRGALALTRAGGVTTHVMEQRMIRVPVFHFHEMAAARRFCHWLPLQREQLQQVIGKKSAYAKLIEIDPQLSGRTVHAHFVYATGDASGQNMTTSCSWQACLWISRQCQQSSDMLLNDFHIDGNMSSDKKVSWQSYIKGRGCRVQAEAFIPESVLKSILKISAAELVRGYGIAVSGALRTGMVGMNINVANVIGAMFSSLGQDIACTHESSLAHLHIEPQQITNNDGKLVDGVYVSMQLPSLVIGTVGGGTSLPQQQECLQILDCSGPGKTARLAEIIAGYCLALDLSTLSAMTVGHFADAHERLGRNKPVNHLKSCELNQSFFQAMLNHAAIASKTSLEKITQLKSFNIIEQSQAADSIVCEFTAHKQNKLLGLIPVDLTTFNNINNVNSNASQQVVAAMLKLKPSTRDALDTLHTVALCSDPQLAKLVDKYEEYSFFQRCDDREIALYQLQHKEFTSITPKLYGLWQDKDRQGCAVLMERLQGLNLFNAVDRPQDWHDLHIQTAIDGITPFHGRYLSNNHDKKHSELAKLCLQNSDKHSMQAQKELFIALQQLISDEFPHWFNHQQTAWLTQCIERLQDWWPKLEQLPHTLIHGDFNPRNIAFRNKSKTDSIELCCWDWELSCWHLPQRDLVELLLYCMESKNITQQSLEYWSEYQRQILSAASNQQLDKQSWNAGFYYAIFDFAINRFAFSALAHNLRDYPFMERLADNLSKVIVLLQQQSLLEELS